MHLTVFPLCGKTAGDHSVLCKNMKNIELSWNQAKSITFEYLRENYSYGDLCFEGLSIEGALDGVLHLSGFLPSKNPSVSADLFLLIKEIYKITQNGQVQHPIFRYDVETINLEQSLKKLTLHFEDEGTTEIEYKDDLLYFCRLSDGRLTEL